MAFISDKRLPIIDLSKITNSQRNDEASSQQASEKRLLFETLRDVGFVYIKGHGIRETAVETLFAHARRLFAQPKSEKIKIETGPSKFFHGWFSPERTSGTAKFSDQKEAFDMGNDKNLARPNQWPKQWPDFQEDMNAFFEKCHEIHLIILSSLAEQVGLPADYFVPYVCDKDHFFRVLYYPKTTLDTFSERVRAGTHTDYGTLTLLFNDDRGGLQVRGKDGTFFDVAPMPGCAIVNVGDLLARWFNDTLKSTEHRVIEPPVVRVSAEGEGGAVIPARYAIAWFGQPNREAFVEPLDSCVTSGTPKRYEGVYAGQHVIDRLATLHQEGRNVEELRRPAVLV